MMGQMHALPPFLSLFFNLTKYRTVSFCFTPLFRPFILELVLEFIFLLSSRQGLRNPIIPSAILFPENHGHFGESYSLSVLPSPLFERAFICLPVSGYGLLPYLWSQFIRKSFQITYGSDSIPINSLHGSSRKRGFPESH